MPTPVPPTDCMNAREAASARLDGELSELEAAHLDSHLRGCAECSGYAREIAAVAGRLRAEPLERPVLPVFTVRRRRPAVRLHTAAAAVTILVAAGSSFGLGQLVGRHESGSTVTVASTASAPVQRRDQVLGMVRHLRLGRLVPTGVIPV